MNSAEPLAAGLVEGEKITDKPANKSQVFSTL